VRNEHWLLSLETWGI